jgi:hypothetical protein
MDNILIEEITNKLNNLGNEKNKVEFIKNYEIAKKDIEEIDLILEKENEFINSNLSLQELFNMLESYKELINNEHELNIFILKKILDLTEILENKLEENEKLNITNIN